MKKWLNVFSPAVLSLLMLLVIITAALLEMKHSDGWSFLAVIIFLPYALFLIATIIFMRFRFKQDVKKIWMYESILLVLMVAFFFFQINNK
ncbi:MAG: hypothetical protein ACOYKE_13730 [Ferruginibacter sp.]